MIPSSHASGTLLNWCWYSKSPIPCSNSLNLILSQGTLNGAELGEYSSGTNKRYALYFLTI